MVDKLFDVLLDLVCQYFIEDFSRRAVAAETPNRVMMSSIWTLPSSMTMSRMAEWRSCRDISILLRVKGVVRDGESMGWDGACT